MLDVYACVCKLLSILSLFLPPSLSHFLLPSFLPSHVPSISFFLTGVLHWTEPISLWLILRDCACAVHGGVCASVLIHVSDSSL